MNTERGKGTVTVVGGAGAVGSSMAFVLMESSLVDEIILVDIAEERVEGEAMDLNHDVYFTSSVRVRAGDYEDCWDADMVIVTAGASQKPGETRLSLMERNADISADMTPQITRGLNGDIMMLIVTNPVDVLSYVTWEVSGLPVERVIGSRTVLDASRLRHSLSRGFDLDPTNVHAYVVGKHGDGEVLVWSSANLGGIPFGSYATSRGVDDIDAFKTRVEEKVREAAYETIKRKERTNYGVACSVAATTERILGGDSSILTVSTLVSGEHGIDDVYISLSCTVNQSGVRDVHEFDLSADETAALQESADAIHESIDRSDLQ